MTSGVHGLQTTNPSLRWLMPNLVNQRFNSILEVGFEEFNTLNFKGGKFFNAKGEKCLLLLLNLNHSITSRLSNGKLLGGFLRLLRFPV